MADPYAVGIVGGVIGLVLVMLYRFPNITGSKAAPSVGGSANRSEENLWTLQNVLQMMDIYIL